jgi:dTDP-4-amino-4,6-dideoxygalactose transaminase
MDCSQLARLVSSRTRAIMPVHLFGQCCDMDAIRAFAGEHGLRIIEDAAQAIGASFNGEMAGSMGDFGCISFYPTKNLGAFGDAGMIVCNDAELAERVRLLANHGMKPRYYHQAVGINSRLDAMQAAILCAKMPGLRMAAAGRQRNAEIYNRLLTAAGMDYAITRPAADPRCGHVWNQYTIRIPGGRRDEVRAALAARKIGTEIYYPVPAHRQQCFEWLQVPAGSLPETERAAAEVLSLPIFPELTRGEMETVVAGLVDAVAGAEVGKRKAA